MTEGFLMVDKPRGLTSHDVVARVRRATGIKKCGHAGTLDPMATGVVLVAVGKVTRLIRFLQDLPKVYEATAVFGVATDSLDADGVETGRREMPLRREELDDLVPAFTGTIMQVPPMVSALKKDGKRLYELAREGVEVERAPRPVDVYSIDIVDVGAGPYPEVSFRVRCGKGTYVRSLADDMARSLGGRAHLVSLRRTSVGALRVGGSLAIERLDDWPDHLLSPLDALVDYPVIDVDDTVARRIVHGQPVDLAGLAGGDGHVRVAHDGRLLAMFEIDGARSRSEVVLT